MEDTDRPNRQSNMEKAEGDRPCDSQSEERGRPDVSDRSRGKESGHQSDPREQEQLVQRHPYGSDPTELDVERTVPERSTASNGGLASGRTDDPVMPADEATEKTKI